MAPVAIVTDTTHYLPRDLASAHDIHQVSLYVNWQDRQDRETDLPDFDAYYEHLRAAERLPTTSQPSIGDFLAVWQPLLDEGRDVVSVHIAGGISGTYESALQAKEEARGGERVEVIDSQTSAGGLGLMVLAGAAVAEAGGDAAAVAARVASRRARSSRSGSRSTRSSTCAGAGAWAPRRRGWARRSRSSRSSRSSPRSPRSSACAPRAARSSGWSTTWSTRHEDGADGWVVQHIQAPDKADGLVERGREIFGSEPVFVSEVGPVIGTHVGPGPARRRRHARVAARRLSTARFRPARSAAGPGAAGARRRAARGRPPPPGAGSPTRRARRSGSSRPSGSRRARRGRPAASSR